MKSKGKALYAVAAISAAAALIGCLSDADVASHNLSKAADNFGIARRVVFYNGITGEYLLEIDGLCSLGNSDNLREVSVTCKTGDNEYKKHFLGMSDNVTYIVQQLDAGSVSTSQYRVIFKPSAILPDIKLK